MLVGLFCFVSKSLLGFGAARSFVSFKKQSAFQVQRCFIAFIAFSLIL